MNRESKKNDNQNQALILCFVKMNKEIINDKIRYK